VATSAETERFSHIVFRLKHDCPVSTLSRQFPKIDFFTWSVHQQEIVYARCDAETEPRLRAAVEQLMPRSTILRSGEGLAWTFESSYPKSRSVSWQLERSRALWLQPLRCMDGWEFFDAIALDTERFRKLVGTLGKKFPLEVVRRAPLSPADLATSFFVPLAPAVQRLTPKQYEALESAHALRYYEQPRHATTRDIAKSLGISRSALEERLRNAENTVLSGVVASLGSLAPRQEKKKS
jgi:predicted DNA binding protein